ncbi:hypothetical protein C482_06242 [Natrialba chahannaoensis JCM 10990]|uniref:Small CPxCG-related zinc finger protein n=1 Tax=Natrialba chahannaoensis JCM 10990 TaxID=1227492 RepID=M0AW58_9EURY|nr:hypothetical protein [Natrialba chahannaoensis]ELZ01629.1 hypothetical protein C482_06242 [Natrialba chahannaoensis JCM 10990]
MWPWSSRSPSATVTCLACGDGIPRSAAREYDKYGNQWDRRDKEFEHLCPTCHNELCHQPRDELEDILVELHAGEEETDAFLARYLATVEDRYGRVEEES